MTRDQSILWEYHLADSLRAVTDSVVLMRALLDELLGIPADSSGAAADSTAARDSTALPTRRPGGTP
jgi:hypothetical protein